MSGVTEWHINADEPIALDYNVEFKTPNQVDDLLRATTPTVRPTTTPCSWASTSTPPHRGCGGPYAVVEGESVTVTRDRAATPTTTR